MLFDVRLTYTAKKKEKMTIVSPRPDIERAHVYWSYTRDSLFLDTL